jgi:hypothetical protein
MVTVRLRAMCDKLRRKCEGQAEVLRTCEMVVRERGCYREDTGIGETLSALQRAASQLNERGFERAVELRSRIERLLEEGHHVLEQLSRPERCPELRRDLGDAGELAGDMEPRDEAARDLEQRDELRDDLKQQCVAFRELKLELPVKNPPN